MKRMCSIVVVMSAIFLSSYSYAQEKDRTQIVQQGFEEGARAYQLSRYDEAIVIWDKTYEMFPDAILRFNSSKASAKLGNYEQAVAYAEAAAENEEHERPLTGKYVMENRGHILAWRAHIIASKNALEIHRRKPPELELDWRGYTGIGVSVIGAGLIVGALVVNADVSSDKDALANIERKPAYDEARGDLESKQTLGLVLLYSGTGLVATGVTFVVWDLFFDSEVDVAVLPTGKSTRVDVRWRF